jgi:dTDP-4-amino-4,6-dideoxygalactose transaminase
MCAPQRRGQANKVTEESLPPHVDSVPFNDLAWQWRQIQSKIAIGLEDIFASSAFILGPHVDRFERAIADFLEAGHAVGVSSGTSALHLALVAAGIGRGDKVLVPANTFVATAWAVFYVGAEPVFCDVEPNSWTIDVVDAEQRVTGGLRAVMPVHLYGQPANMDAVAALASRHGLVVIEDVAQAIGARYRGRRVGTIGDLGCFSFYPGKNLGAAGDAGLVTTNNADVADRLRALRNHAQFTRFRHDELGFNYRMDGIQGLVLGHKLPLLEAWTSERRRIARQFQDRLQGLPLELPVVANGDHVWHLFVVHTPERDKLREHLTRLGIETGLHYPIPLHRQPCFSDLAADPKGFPNADRNARECLSLPLFVGMTDSQIDRVIGGVRSYFERKS